MVRGRIGASAADDPSEHEHIVDEEWEAAAIRRAPRHGRILFLAIAVGLAISIVHTTLSTISAEPGDPLASNASGVLRVLGVLAAVWVGLGLLIGATVIIVLEGVATRRIRPVVTEHTTTITDDLVSPVTDEVPQWVRQADDLRADGRDGATPGRPGG